MTSLKTLLLEQLCRCRILHGNDCSCGRSLYRFNQGDTLSTISQKYVGDNSSINAIAESNSPFLTLTLILPGQQLTIPTEGSDIKQLLNLDSRSRAPVQAEPVLLNNLCCKPNGFKRERAAPVVETQSATTETTATSTMPQKNGSHKKNQAVLTQQTNGRYIGRYQLDSSYLNGDYSAANQEKVAEQYVASRYGSWEAAKAFWEANGWY